MTASRIGERSREHPKPLSRGRLAAPLIADILIPVALFYALTAAGLSAVTALALGAVPPAGRVAYSVLRSRQVDGLAILVLLVVAAAIALTLVSGNARFALAKESFFTGAASVWVLGTVIAGKPMIYTTLRPFATRGDPARDRAWAGLWQSSPRFRALIRDLTLVWGLAFLADAVARWVVAYSVPVRYAAALVHLPAVVFLLLAVWYTKLRGRALRAMLDTATGHGHGQ